jgi:hypothetical protein
MSVAAYRFDHFDDRFPVLPRGVASPSGHDTIFDLREAWLRATKESAEKMRLRDWLDREVLRLQPDATSPKASVRLRRQHERAVSELKTAKREEEAALTREDAIVDRIFATPVETIPGFVAKLQFLVRYGTPGPGIDEFPWPQLEALLHDLQRLTMTEWIVLEP